MMEQVLSAQKISAVASRSLSSVGPITSPAAIASLAGTIVRSASRSGRTRKSRKTPGRSPTNSGNSSIVAPCRPRDFQWSRRPSGSSRWEPHRCPRSSRNSCSTIGGSCASRATGMTIRSMEPGSTSTSTTTWPTTPWNSTRPTAGIRVATQHLSSSNAALFESTTWHIVFLRCSQMSPVCTCQRIFGWETPSTCGVARWCCLTATISPRSSTRNISTWTNGRIAWMSLKSR
mmetsp:Transcript_70414/g.111226  ORF Transcript_70414/g.111226 Transcript_70414/m.111226 type:complete len:232 (-) Transcript_70414:735-1430(-)